MKSLLSLLMIYVFLQVQAQALSGGPVFGGGGNSNTGVNVGTFAGVLLPSDANTSGLTSSTSNSLGLFSLGSPSTGLATGSFSYFDSGATYVGTITGIVDPDSLRLRGLVRGTFTFTENFTFNDGSQVFIFAGPSGYANGSVNARLKAGSGFVSSSLAVRITGKANLDVQAADATTSQPIGTVRSLILDVDGFKQSTTVNGVTDLSSLINNSSTGSGTGSGSGG